MDERKRYLLYAGAAGAVGYIWLCRASSRRTSPTEFDAFLRAPVSDNAQQSASATSFDAFLREQPQQTDSTNFASFLRVQPASAKAVAVQPLHNSRPAAADIPGTAVPVLVVFGTEYGLAQEIAEKLCIQLAGTGRYWPTLVNAAHHPGGCELSKQQAAFFVISTQGDGVPPTEAREFCEWLFKGGAGDLSGLTHSVCALGDSAYAHFCRCGKQVDAALVSAGATELLPRTDIDKEDWAKVDGWINGVLSGLGALANLQTIDDLGGRAAAADILMETAAAATTAASTGYSKSRPYYARAVAVEGLCTLSGLDDKDTVRLELELPADAAEVGLGYTPGDALGIWPANSSQVVEELLQQLGASGDENIQTPSWHYQEDPKYSAAAAAAKHSSSDGQKSTITLRRALTVCYDLKTPKAQQLLQQLLGQLQQQQQQQPSAGIGGASSEKAVHAKPANSHISYEVKADASTNGMYQDSASANGTPEELNGAEPFAPKGTSSTASIARISHLLNDSAALQLYLDARHVADILQDCPGIQVALERLLPLLRPLQPRLYSISSSPLEHIPANGGVQATIAVVRYNSLGKARHGVASTQVAERLEVDSYLPVFIFKNPDFRLPADLLTPIIMVGPGTGLAPFRSFILHRIITALQQQHEAAHQQPGQIGPMHLFFGCRRHDQDFLYGDQLQQWHNDGVITLHTAFSRETDRKVYVQQRLREVGDQMWQLLEAGAHFYVCGDAGSMAGVVEATMLDIIQQHQGPDSNAGSAAAYLRQLAASGRYQRDVWFS